MADTTPRYPEVMKWVMHEIEVGAMRPYSKLPTATSLASQFRTSQMTVTKALDLLVTYPWLYRIAGETGYYVGPNTEAPVRKPAKRTRRTLSAVSPLNVTFGEAEPATPAKAAKPAARRRTGSGR